MQLTKLSYNDVNLMNFCHRLYITYYEDNKIIAEMLTM